MDIKYLIANKYMKCVLQINGFSGPRPWFKSSRRVWGHDKKPTSSDHISMLMNQTKEVALP